MLEVFWDDSIKPQPEMSEDESKIKQWDEWFKIAGLDKEWKCVKGVFPDDIKKQLSWANIIEMNRLNAKENEK